MRVISIEIWLDLYLSNCNERNYTFQMQYHTSKDSEFHLEIWLVN